MSETQKQKHTASNMEYTQVSTARALRSTTRALRKQGYKHTRYTQADRGRCARSYYTHTNTHVVCVVCNYLELEHYV